MKTLEQLIIERVEEKRRADEERKRKQIEEAAFVSRREEVVASLFREWLGKEYGFDASDLAIQASWNGARQYYTISLETPENGNISYRNPVTVGVNNFRPGEDTPTISIAYTDKSTPWHATIPGRGERLYYDFVDFIEAYMYCLWGTSNPSEEALQALRNYRETE